MVTRSGGELNLLTEAEEIFIIASFIRVKN